ncbi:ABC transporter ATP-binding protein [Candidatus Babeliales bacterium]|nr:ABC transporter ATP-binding protein [Candidatus Babeliales bacterium]
MNNIFVKIINLKKYYQQKNGVVKALDNISFDINKGEVIGLLGINGAGKTTLSSILATLHPPTGGDIIFKDKSIYKDINEYRKFIGYCPQKPNLIMDLTVKQNLIFAGKYYGLCKNAIEERFEKLVKKYALQKYLYETPTSLSGGYKQRVMIARTLMHQPKFIILDEPTVGLDPHIRHQLWETIRELKKEEITILLTTHYIEEAEILADRICILDKGKIKLIDTPENLSSIYQKSRLEEVFLQLMHEETE